MANLTRTTVLGRALLLGSTSCLALGIFSGSAAAGCAAPDTTSLPGTDIVTCAGSVTGTNASAIDYSSASSVILNWTAGSAGASIATTGSSAFGINANSDTGSTTVTSSPKFPGP